MKHSIKKIVYSWQGEPKEVIEEIDGKLGSDIFDKNGREIFEGNKVIFRGQDKQTYKGVVEFVNGSFFIRYERYGAPNFFVNLGDSFYVQDIKIADD